MTKYFAFFRESVKIRLSVAKTEKYFFGGKNENETTAFTADDGRGGNLRVCGRRRCRAAVCKQQKREGLKRK